jgi:hypothetical protein
MRVETEVRGRSDRVRKLVPWGFLVRVCALLSQTRRGFWPACGFLALDCMHMQAFPPTRRRFGGQARFPCLFRRSRSSDEDGRLRIPLRGTELRTPVCHTASACGGMPCKLAEGSWTLLTFNQLLQSGASFTARVSPLRFFSRNPHRTRMRPAIDAASDQRQGLPPVVTFRWVVTKRSIKRFD